MLLHLLPKPPRVFVRACPIHMEELPADSLRCPCGHRCSAENESHLLWLVLELPSGRTAARVYASRVEFEAWFEDWMARTQAKLNGRTKAGFAA